MRNSLENDMLAQQEPTIAVGLMDRTEAVTIQLKGKFQANQGQQQVGPGELHIHRVANGLSCSGCIQLATGELVFTPMQPTRDQFALEAIIGIDFHWQQPETQSFHGALRVIADGADRLTVINEVPLETYLTSVICSEMNATSPPAAIRSHAVISRSWLLAQLDRAAPSPPAAQSSGSPHVRWTERAAHATFDVCADDHCQRYQGTTRTHSPDVAAAIAETRGQVLTYQGEVCDARFSKCCGGVVEEYQTAWADRHVPYLVAFADAADRRLPDPPLTEEAALRRYVEQPPLCYCNCTDAAILERVLNDYDRTTRDFFRWQVRLMAAEASELVAQKLQLDLGRLLAVEPLARGPSGRLKLVRLVGTDRSVEIGKELEIRRALSPSHLYSSAFIVATDGPRERPEAFVLSGAGWGHGVGLCQIGAAVMACQGIDHPHILRHYYPGAKLERWYS